MYKDFITSLHSKTKRNYLARVNNKKFPKDKAAIMAKKWGYHYWDGSRDINYGGYKYIPGRWNVVIKNLIKFYNLKKNSKILDVGCGKGFFLYDLKKILKESTVCGIDISKYAIKKAPTEIKKNLVYGKAQRLPWPDKYFDLAVSFNTLHCLKNFELFKALKELQRVSKKKYLCVESYRNETEKMNLLYWQVTCESFYSPQEWVWLFKQAKYKGDYSFIYFQ
jgi:protein-L-isoaspartate(D-aspartate) O-methyltransferase